MKEDKPKDKSNATYEAKGTCLYYNGILIVRYESDELAKKAAKRWRNRHEKFQQNK